MVAQCGGVVVPQPRRRLGHHHSAGRATDDDAVTTRRDALPDEGLRGVVVTHPRCRSHALVSCQHVSARRPAAGVNDALTASGGAGTPWAAQILDERGRHGANGALMARGSRDHTWRRGGCPRVEGVLLSAASEVGPRSVELVHHDRHGEWFR